MGSTDNFFEEDTRRMLWENFGLIGQ